MIGSATSVHPQETTEQPIPYLSYRKKMIIPVQAEYDATVNLYRSIDDRDFKLRTADLWGCKMDAWLSVSKSSRRVIVLSNSCRLRWCPLCSANKAHRMSDAMSQWLKVHPRPKLLTLTLKHSDDSLDKQITRLYSAFREFRRIKYFKENIRGGIWFFQVKWIEFTQQWHPHLHCIMDSEYLPHEAIKQHWKRITGDSDIVDIRVIRKAKLAADYVARYAARPAKLADLSPAQRMEVFDALHGRRLCGKWGTAAAIDWSVNDEFTREDYVPVAKFDNMHKHTKTSRWASLLWDCYKMGESVPLCWDLTKLDFEYDWQMSPLPKEPDKPPEPFLPF